MLCLHVFISVLTKFTTGCKKFVLCLTNTLVMANNLGSQDRHRESGGDALRL